MRGRLVTHPEAHDLPGPLDVRELHVGVFHLLGLVLQFAPRGRTDGFWASLGRAPVVVQAAVVLVTILGIDLLGPDGVAPFIYFAF